jgi:hypothetical protein
MLRAKPAVFEDLLEVYPIAGLILSSSFRGESAAVTPVGCEGSVFALLLKLARDWS